MLRIYTWLQAHTPSDDGATAVEYGILVSLIALAIILAVAGLGTKLAGTFTTAGASLP